MLFEVLGPISVELADGSHARVPRGRVQEFLALLLVHRGDTMHLERIVDELWGEPGPRNQKNAVHVLASRLRGAGLGDAVVFEGGGYALRAPGATLDADLFEAGLRRGRAELASGQAAQAAVTLSTALALWRGPALLDVCDARFAQPEIARLEDLRLACVGERIEADLACGREAEVTGELESLVHRHPFRERLRGQLMTALYRSGRQAEALATYREARGALVEGLGIEPSPWLRELERAILRHALV
jgi:DNA-binding SARP family transcriptional activator